MSSGVQARLMGMGRARFAGPRVWAAFTLAALSATPVMAQASAQAATPGSADEAAVRAVVVAMFDAMRAGDGDALRAILTDDATLVTTGEREGRPFMNSSPGSSWVASVAGSAPGRLNEVIHDEVVHVDQNLAVVWAPYRFHLGDVLQHCGTNVIQMFRTESGWRVFHLADTRRRDGCDP